MSSLKQPPTSGPFGLSVEESLKAHISRTGFLTVADFMDVANQHYYSAKDPFGQEGDFITAPEISQLFGEIIALSVIDSWQASGCPAPVTLAELGPGRGTLMADFLRTAQAVPDFLAAMTVALMETSPLLKQKQQKALSPYVQVCSFAWYERLEGLLDTQQPLFLVANEFLDALPIHQYEKTRAGWQERVLTLKDPAFVKEGCSLKDAGENGDQDVFLSWSHRAVDPASSLMSLLENQPASFIETSPIRLAVFRRVAEHISQFGGCALFIDYGDRHFQGETLQAVQHHQYWPVLKAPGEADLTSHVDFGVLEQDAHQLGLEVIFETQRQFLKRHYIEVRLQHLVSQLSLTQDESRRQRLISGYERLTEGHQMGTLFKVLTLCSIK